MFPLLIAGDILCTTPWLDTCQTAILGWKRKQRKCILTNLLKSMGKGIPGLPRSMTSCTGFQWGTYISVKKLVLNYMGRWPDFLRRMWCCLQLLDKLPLMLIPMIAWFGAGISIALMHGPTSEEGIAVCLHRRSWRGSKSSSIHNRVNKNTLSHAWWECICFAHWCILR